MAKWQHIDRLGSLSKGFGRIQPLVRRRLARAHKIDSKRIGRPMPICTSRIIIIGCISSSGCRLGLSRKVHIVGVTTIIRSHVFNAPTRYLVVRP